MKTNNHGMLDDGSGRSGARRGLVFGKNGFTLVEMIMVVVILGIISTMGFSFIASSVQIYLYNKSEGKLTTEAWAALNRVILEVAFADAATITAPATPPATGTGSTLTFTTITNTFPAGFTAAANCANCVDNSTTISYSLNGSQLIRNTAANNSQVIADGITAFSVTMSKINRTIPGGLQAANAPPYDTVTLNLGETVTPGQAVGLLINMTNGACSGQIRHITSYDATTQIATVFPVWNNATAAGDAYALSSYYLTITLTKQDASTGISTTLTQSIYPNSNATQVVN